MPSVTQTLPARSTWMPWGRVNRPAPKLFNSWPLASNFMIGASGEQSQANGWPGLNDDGGAKAPQRSATHTLMPSGSMSTPPVEPQVRPSGSLAQLSIDRYGLGAELNGVVG